MSSRPDGDVFGGRFVILRSAAEGGMGRVYEALDAAGRRLAVKVVLDGNQLTRFAAEAEILERLAHPAIVEYVGHGTTNGGWPYLAMEWLDGECLGTRLERGPLPVDEVITLGRRIASALARAHEGGIVHRDLKPSNLFLVGGRVDCVKLIDFGIARRSGQPELTYTGQLLGTPAFMAPEQAQGWRNIDGRADVFALGSVLYAAITGRSAFDGSDFVDVLSRVVLLDPPQPAVFVPACPPRLDALVCRMLAKDPSERPQSALAVVDELDAIGREMLGSKTIGSDAFSNEMISSEMITSRMVGSEPAIVLADADADRGSQPAVTGRALSQRQTGADRVMLPPTRTHRPGRPALVLVVAIGIALAASGWIAVFFVQPAIRPAPPIATPGGPPILPPIALHVPADAASSPPRAPPRDAAPTIVVAPRPPLAPTVETRTLPRPKPKPQPPNVSSNVPPSMSPSTSSSPWSPGDLDGSYRGSATITLRIIEPEPTGPVNTVGVMVVTIAEPSPGNVRVGLTVDNHTCVLNAQRSGTRVWITPNQHCTQASASSTIAGVLTFTRDAIGVRLVFDAHLHGRGEQNGGFELEATYRFTAHRTSVPHARQSRKSRRSFA